jgi:hypothetical protein
MAIIQVAGPIGKVIYIPANEKDGKEALLNVGICEKPFRRGGIKTVWYQAVWTGVEAEKKKRIMDKVKALTITGHEDFRINTRSEKQFIERTIWVIHETVHWKEKEQQTSLDLDT